jgi:hypothetical protein
MIRLRRRVLLVSVCSERRCILGMDASGDDFGTSEIAHGSCQRSVAPEAVY